MKGAQKVRDFNALAGVKRKIRHEQELMFSVLINSALSMLDLRFSQW
jgi:hypothetical protein